MRDEERKLLVNGYAEDRVEDVVDALCEAVLAIDAQLNPEPAPEPPTPLRAAQEGAGAACSAAEIRGETYRVLRSDEAASKGRAAVTYFEATCLGTEGELQPLPVDVRTRVEAGAGYGDRGVIRVGRQSYSVDEAIALNLTISAAIEHATEAIEADRAPRRGHG